ncbi:histone-lysine N-methyltransferase SETMAR [Trichonephila clavipes]|nr:histone-lysine N-methyltransferase SETMAR [Trichonephila clavipes]
MISGERRIPSSRERKPFRYSLHGMSSAFQARTRRSRVRYLDPRHNKERESLLKRHENNPFLKRIITGDEKLVVYNNVKRKRSWSKKDEPAQTISKADIHQKKSDAVCLVGF